MGQLRSPLTARAMRSGMSAALVAFAAALPSSCKSDLAERLAPAERCTDCDQETDVPATTDTPSETNRDPDAASNPSTEPELDAALPDAAALPTSGTADVGPDGSAPPVGEPVICERGTRLVKDANGSRCEACDTGFFADTTGATECTEWTSCQPGEFVERTGDAARDRSCAPCPEGETSTEPNAGACTRPGECSAGSHELEDNSCEECDAGTYCAGGAAEPVACEGNTWDDDAAPATPCVNKSGCPVGKYVQDPGSATEDRVCATCASGTFTASANQATCSPWSDCLPGTRVSRAGNTTRDRNCDECESSTFTDANNLPSCSPWEVCEAPTEFELEAPTSESDRQCGTCAGSTTTTDDNQAQCSDPAYTMVDDVVAIEAEHFSATDDRGTSATWLEYADASISGGAGLQLGPETGVFWIDDPANVAPRLDYRVNFSRPGTFTLFVRGDAQDGSGGSDSCWGGIDGSVTPSYVFSTLPDVWGWIGQPIDVASAGVHIVTIYGREDGFHVDKLVITADGTAPTGSGPDESALE